MKNIRFKLIWMLAIGGLLVIGSCSKEEDKNYGGSSSSSSQVDRSTMRRVKKVMGKLPMLKLVQEYNQFHRNAAGSGTGKMLDGTGWTFSHPGVGVGFTVSGTGVTFVVGTNTIFVAPGAFGGNSSSGTVVAGSSALDMNYTFCFSSSQNSVGLDLFDMGNGGFSNVSGVVGVSGDFEELANATDSTPFADIFHGLGFYIVYSDQTEGTHDVVDWANSDLNDTTAIDDMCFAFLFDFQQGKLYMSKSGTIEVSGGSMNFNGEYFEVSGFINDDGDFDLDGDLTLSVVPGFGAMGCN